MLPWGLPEGAVGETSGKQEELRSSRICSRTQTLLTLIVSKMDNISALQSLPSEQCVGGRGLNFFFSLV